MISPLQSTRIGLTSLSLAILTSCTPAYNQKFGMSFLPPSPRQVVTSVPLLQPPKAEPNLFLSESAAALKPNLQISPKPTQVDLIVRRAEERFQDGKRLYLAGDTAKARSAFDRAIEVLLDVPESVADRLKVERKLEELVSAIHRYDVNGMGAGNLSGKLAYDRVPLEDILEMTFPVDPKLKPKVDEQLSATQSQLPLKVTDAVLSYINFFSSDRGHKTLLAGLRRAGRYKPLISRILTEEKVPQELIYLAQAESGFLPRARSNKAAVGMWQFVQWRGRQYGLMQTAFTDDRMDPEKATRSAARHLRDLYEKFGDWYLAIAAYNCGDGCVEKAVQRTGYADFWEIRSRNAIPKETTNYVPIIVAMAIMHKNAKDYGLENIETDDPLEFDTFTVPSATHLALVADAADRPVSELRDLNPALLTNVAPAGYEVHVPTGTKNTVLAALDAIPEGRRASWRIHRVSAGDTLATIAKRYNTPVSSIANLNPSAEPEVGNVLIIPTTTQLERMRPSKPVVKTPRRGSPRAASKDKSLQRGANVSGVQTAGLR